MGFYDITNDIPLELNIEGIKNKNNSLFLLKNYLNKSKIPLNSILVLDRAYCSYEFIDFLIKTKYKFIIRFRNNCKNFNKIQNLNNIRILKYNDEVKNIIPYDKYKNYIDKKKEKEIKKNKKEKKSKNIQLPNDDKYNIVFKNAEVIMKYEYTLLTNLNSNDYNDEKIKELYKQRWSIEIFFKLLKYNFKFEHLIEHILEIIKINLKMLF
jgi:IS4 transposase